MDFNGGGGIVGLNPGGGFVPTNLVPQNQANLDYVNAVNQASLNPNTLYGPGGFGYQTDQYSAAGAAYGRQTGYYGDPYSATPVSPSSGAGYADRSSLDEAGQAYYDAHVARYGAPPFSDNPGVQGPAGPPAPTPPATPSVQEQAAASDAGSGIGIGVGPRTDTGEGAAVDFNSLNAQQQAYYQAHVAKYGTAPGAGNTTLTGMADSGGPSSGGGAGTQFSTPFTPSGPVASDPYSGGGHPTDPGEGAALDPSTWNTAQKAYADAHLLKYNTLPGANNATMKGLADAPPMEEAPPSSPGGLIPGGGGGGGAGYNPAFGTVGGSGGGFTQPTDPGEGAALDPSTWNDAQKAYAGAHVLKYNTLPGADNATMRSLADAPPPMAGGEPIPGLGGPFQTATGDAGQSPGMAPGMGGFSPAGFRTDPGEGAPVVYESLNDPQKSYYKAHYEKYGTAPGANNSTLAGMGTAPTSGPGSGIEAIDKAAGIDPNTGNEFPPGVDRNTGQPYGLPPAGTPTDPGEGGALNFFTLNAQQQAYDLAHYAKYKTLAGADNPALKAMGLGGPEAPDQKALADQRASFADQLSNNPDMALDWATRLYLESTGNSQTRQAIAEAMMNRQTSTGEDVMNNSAYFPINKPAYNAQYTAARQMLQNNEALRTQIYGELGNAIGGSNYSNYATDWASGDTAANEASYATPTWTSPDSEQFFRKDIYSPSTGQTDAGQGIAKANSLWYNSLHGAPPM